MDSGHWQCTADQHDPIMGRFHGACYKCGEDWPCSTVRNGERDRWERFAAAVCGGFAAAASRSVVIERQGELVSATEKEELLVTMIVNAATEVADAMMLKSKERWS